ncbi:MAG: hypothetical protein IGS23_04440 [Rivularia sp. T60_A2020_040]|nr:hypothetical protein [Rivularia sp. T60_A2020_040]
MREKEVIKASYFLLFQIIGVCDRALIAFFMTNLERHRYPENNLHPQYSDNTK